VAQGESACEQKRGQGQGRGSAALGFWYGRMEGTERRSGGKTRRRVRAGRTLLNPAFSTPLHLTRIPRSPVMQTALNSREKTTGTGAHLRTPRPSFPTRMSSSTASSETVARPWREKSRVSELSCERRVAEWMSETESEPIKDKIADGRGDGWMGERRERRDRRAIENPRWCRVAAHPSFQLRL
jgi:hypothetical protein